MANGRILVVDDEESLCEILQFNLESEGYEVTTANSAEEALRLDIKSFDLILLDVMMGQMSGTRMASLLKADPETAQIPIIFCTARDGEDDRVAGLDLGADDYIAKPFSVRELVARVKSVLRRTRHGDEEGEERIVYEVSASTAVARCARWTASRYNSRKRSWRYSCCCSRTAAASSRASRSSTASGATR